MEIRGDAGYSQFFHDSSNLSFLKPICLINVSSLILCQNHCACLLSDSNKKLLDHFKWSTSKINICMHHSLTHLHYPLRLWSLSKQWHHTWSRSSWHSLCKEYHPRMSMWLQSPPGSFCLFPKSLTDGRAGPEPHTGKGHSWPAMMQGSSSKETPNPIPAARPLP